MKYLFSHLFLFLSFFTLSSKDSVQMQQKTQAICVDDHDDDPGADLLRAFFKEILPGFLNIVVGSKTDNKQQAHMGINQFKDGVVSFFSHAANRSEKNNYCLELLKTMSDENIEKLIQESINSIEDENKK